VPGDCGGGAFALRPRFLAPAKDLGSRPPDVPQSESQSFERPHRSPNGLASRPFGQMRRPIGAPLKQFAAVREQVRPRGWDEGAPSAAATVLRGHVAELRTMGLAPQRPTTNCPAVPETKGPSDAAAHQPDSCGMADQLFGPHRSDRSAAAVPPCLRRIASAVSLAVGCANRGMTRLAILVPLRRLLALAGTTARVSLMRRCAGTPLPCLRRIPWWLLMPPWGKNCWSRPLLPHPLGGESLAGLCSLSLGLFVSYHPWRGALW